MKITTDKEADILAIDFQTGNQYAGGELLNEFGVIVEYDTDDNIMRLELQRYQANMFGVMMFLNALMGIEIATKGFLRRKDLLPYLNYQQLTPLTIWFTPQGQKTTAA